MRVIVSGGGTGGHIFPAISIANALKEADPNVDILFVGAKGKMEMGKVPAAGYKIIGLPVAGFHRKLSLYNICRNMLFPFKLVASMLKARSVIKEFKPDVAVGVGGYASGPILRRAAKSKVPCLILEPNSFPGVTNKILAKDVNTICVGYPHMDRFFPIEKIKITGSPVRQSLLEHVERAEAANYFGLNPNLPVILVIGGSLGARSINEGLKASLDDLHDDVQLLWQTGKFYYDSVKQELDTRKRSNVVAMDFVKRMDFAYALADIVISRAGAGSISELALLGKPSILVPSPNVSEDHQTKNAMSLVEKNAAIMVKDSDTAMLLAESQLVLSKSEQLSQLAHNIKQFANPSAANDIANEVMNLVRQNG